MIKAEAITEEEKLAEFAGQALRGPKYGIYQQLLCQHLVQATVTSDPLRKIELVCDAALMVDTKKQRALQIDVEKLEAVKAVADAFQHRTLTNIRKNMRVVSVEFGFTTSQENYNRYIEAWWSNQRLNFYARLMNNSLGKTYVRWYCRRCGNLVKDETREKTGITDGWKCKFCGADLEQDSLRNPQPFFFGHGFKPSEDAPRWSLFFQYCQRLTPRGYATLQNSFLKWAMPFTMQLMNRLTQVVRPEIYNEIAKMFVKARRETEGA